MLEQPAQALAQLNHGSGPPDEARRDVALNSRCWARVLLSIELDQALDDCDAAIDAEPKNAAYLDSRGWVHLRMGNDKKALADFDRSLELRPGTAWSLYGRGLTKRRLGDDAGAEADLARRARRRPTSTEADTRGIASRARCQALGSTRGSSPLRPARERTTAGTLVISRGRM